MAKFESQWKPTLSEIKPYLTSKPLKESVLIRKINELTEAFVLRNDLLKTYGNDDAYVNAYTQLFLTTNIPKLEFIIDCLGPLRTQFEEKPWQFIDFGCGPGTYSLSWLKQFPQSEVLPIDSATNMQKQAHELVRGLFGEQYLRQTVNPDLPKVLCFGNVINEMGSKESLKVIKRYDPECIIWIEPGTKDSFKKVMPVREELLKQGYHCAYPCMSSSACPIIENNQDDWCHQVLRMGHSLEVERICQLARRDRKIMPFIGHVYFKEKLEQKKEYRLVQFLAENKHSYQYRVCFEENEMLVLKKLILPKSKLSKDIKKSIKKASIGVSVQLKVLNETPNEIRAQIMDPHI